MRGKWTEGLYRAPEGPEVDLIRLVAAEPRISHDNPALEPFCDDSSTLAKPDVFNSCHDLGWLHSTHDVDSSQSWVVLTESGRAALSLAHPQPKGEEA